MSYKMVSTKNIELIEKALQEVPVLPEVDSETFYVVRPSRQTNQVVLTEEIWSGGYSNVLRSSRPILDASVSDVQTWLAQNGIEEVITINLG